LQAVDFGDIGRCRRFGFRSGKVRLPGRVGRSLKVLPSSPPGPGSAPKRLDWPLGTSYQRSSAAIAPIEVIKRRAALLRTISNADLSSSACSIASSTTSTAASIASLPQTGRVGTLPAARGNFCSGSQVCRTCHRRQGSLPALPKARLPGTIGGSCSALVEPDPNSKIYGTSNDTDVKRPLYPHFR
jgi:hypothetical protein